MIVVIHFLLDRLAWCVEISWTKSRPVANIMISVFGGGQTIKEARRKKLKRMMIHLYESVIPIAF